MKDYIFILFIFGAIGMHASDTNNKYSRFIIKYSESSEVLKPESLQDMLKELGYKVKTIRKLNLDNHSSKLKSAVIHNSYGIIEMEDTVDLKTIKSRIKNISAIEYIEPDYCGSGSGEIIPNDERFDSQWSLKNYKNTDIDMEKAWDITTGDTTIVAAILDTGCKLDHSEFSGRLWINKDEIPGNNIDDDENGYVDDVNGWDFINADNDPVDNNGHGTNVTGILGATGNNGAGISGIDWKCKLMVLKGLDKDNNGLYSQWIEGIYYAVNNGANVINLSLGGSGYSQAMKEAIDFAWNNGVTVVACMMNADNETTYYPAGYENSIAVGATNKTDERATPFCWGGGSNFGAHIDLVAPGEQIISLSYSSNTGFSTYCGTSQATPHVAGVASLLNAIKKKITPTEIREVLTSTAQDMIGKASEDITGWDKYYGHGRLNAYRALNAVKTSGVVTYKKDAEIYPNPVRTNSFITVNMKENLAAVQSVKIVDMAGRVSIPEYNVNGNSIRLKLVNTEGVYFILVKTTAGIYRSKVIVL